jgi:hypothetical protein
METHRTTPNGILTARVRKLFQACWIWFKLNLTHSKQVSFESICESAVLAK